MIYGSFSKLFNKLLHVHINNQRDIIKGVKLRLIQAPMRLNFSLWRPNPESWSPKLRLYFCTLTMNKGPSSDIVPFYKVISDLCFQKNTYKIK